MRKAPPRGPFPWGSPRWGRGCQPDQGLIRRSMEAPLHRSAEATPRSLPEGPARDHLPEKARRIAGSSSGLTARGRGFMSSEPWESGAQGRREAGPRGGIGSARRAKVKEDLRSCDGRCAPPPGRRPATDGVDLSHGSLLSLYSMMRLRAFVDPPRVGIGHVFGVTLGANRDSEKSPKNLLALLRAPNSWKDWGWGSFPAVGTSRLAARSPGGQ